MNITLITSIIDISNKPLSYTNTRSVYTKKERFEQTKQTIKSIKEKIPNNKIVIVECSNLSEEEKTYFIENSDYFINIYDSNDINLINKMNSYSKSMCEGTMTIYALDKIIKNFKFDNLYKISGRYYLSDTFDLNIYNNDKNVAYIIDDVASTVLYKLTYTMCIKWYNYLFNSENEFNRCEGYEVIFKNFLNQSNEPVLHTPVLGIMGNVSVAGTLFKL